MSLSASYMANFWKHFPRALSWAEISFFWRVIPYRYKKLLFLFFLDEGTRGSIPMDMDEEDVKPKINDEDLSKIKVDDDDLDLQFALNKARRLKQRKQFDHDRTA